MGCCCSKTYVEKHKKNIDYVSLSHNQDTLSTVSELSVETECSDLDPPSI